MRGTCSVCKFWVSKDPNYGDCRFNPPVVIAVSPEQYLEARWPRTEPDDWCGKFEQGRSSEEP